MGVFKRYRRKMRGLRRKPVRKYVRRVMRRPIKKSYKKIVTVKRTFVLGTIAQTNANQHFAYTFKLADLPNYTELTNLYDQYKIKGISVRLVPNVTSADINPVASSVGLPSLHSVLDFSDSTALTSLNDYFQYSTYKRTDPLKPHKRFLYPKQLQYAYDAVTAAAIVADVKNDWVRSESPNVQHLGLKLMCPAATANSCSYDLFATYYVLLKQTK